MKTVIELKDYLEYQPIAEERYRDEEIISAIKFTYTLLDAECGGAITDRWDLPQTDPLYLSDAQKEHIKNAFLIQTQYVLMCGLDFSKGNDQFSFGSFSMGSNRPNRNLICPQALKELQLSGVFYQTDFLQMEQGRRKFGNISPWDELQEPMIIDYPYGRNESDKRYIHQITTNPLQFGRWLRYNDQGIVDYVDFDFLDYYTKEDVDKLLALKQDKLPDYSLGYLKWDGEKLVWSDISGLSDVVTYDLDDEGNATIWIGTDEESFRELGVDVQLSKYYNKKDVDGKDESTLNSANSYTDQEIKKIDLSKYELISNKTTVINSGSTDDQYPTAKATYDIVESTASQLEDLISDNTTAINNLSTSKQDTIADLETIRTNANLVNTKQDTLVNQQNIKSINGQSLLGSGNIDIAGGEGYDPDEITITLNENQQLQVKDYVSKTELTAEADRAKARENEIEAKIPTEQHLYKHLISVSVYSDTAKTEATLVMCYEFECFNKSSTKIETRAQLDKVNRNVSCNGVYWEYKDFRTPAYMTSYEGDDMFNCYYIVNNEDNKVIKYTKQEIISSTYISDEYMTITDTVTQIL